MMIDRMRPEEPSGAPAVPTSPAASPPKAWETAVRWGTAVIGTHERGTPTATPTAIAPAIQPQFTIAGENKVPTTASDIAATPAATPRRAVFGSFIQWRASTKRAVAARYAS